MCCDEGGERVLLTLLAKAVALSFSDTACLEDFVEDMLEMSISSPAARSSSFELSAPLSPKISSRPSFEPSPSCHAAFAHQPSTSSDIESNFSFFAASSLTHCGKM